MPSDSEISKCLQEYAESNKLNGPVGVFCGGTSGIGLSTAVAFVEATKNSSLPPTVYIVGRSAARGEAAKEQLTKINPKIKYQFLQHDLLYIEQAKRVANIIKTHENYINLLSVSQGSFPANGQRLTDEGLEEKMAVSYYSRWAIINDLIPLLIKGAEKAKADGVTDTPGAAVITALAAGLEDPKLIDTTDYGLTKHNYSFPKVMALGPTYNTMIADKFAREYPQIAFIHTYSGLVNSDVFRGLPWFVRPIANVVTTIFGRIPQSAGNANAYAALISATTGSANIFNPKGEEIYNPEVRQKGEGLFNKEAQEDLWKHTQEVFEKAISLDTSK